MPASLFFLEFELPNSDLYHLLITDSPSEISWSFNSSQIKWAKQKRRAEKYVQNHTSVIFRNHSLTSYPSYKAANQRIIYLHSSPPCSNQNIRKKSLADIQQLGLMKGTFVMWFISKCKSLRVKHQMEMNQKIPLWAESNFPCLAGEKGYPLKEPVTLLIPAWTHQHCREQASSPLD